MAWKHVVWLALHVSVVCDVHGGAVPCAKTGVEPPAVRTLMASVTNPANEAWVVAPDCNVTVLQTMPSGDRTALVIVDPMLAIARIDSIPTNVHEFLLSRSNLSHGADFTRSKNLYSVELWRCSLTSIANIKLPQTLPIFSVSYNPLTSIKGVQLPPRLTSLALEGNQIQEIDFALPPQAVFLKLSSNPLTKLEGIVFPDSTQILNLFNTRITVLRGCKFPSALTDLKLPLTTFTEIEVRETDFQILSRNRFTANSTQTVCKDATARLATIGSAKLCVISDAQFDNVYGSSSQAQGGSSASTRGDGIITSSPVLTAPPTASKMKKDLEPSWSVLLPTLAGATACVAVASIAYWLWMKRRWSKTHDSNLASTSEFVAVVDHGRLEVSDIVPSTMGGTTNNTNLSESSVYDVRYDSSVTKYRLDEREVEIMAMVARGGFGAIYRGSYRGQTVAIKQMLPGTLRKESALAGFMAEIRLCATLQHAKIVTFVGITWTSLVDLAAVIEFMPGGDLHDLLYTQPQSSASHWYESWTSSPGTVAKSKTLIAQDVVEALVYLHSFSPSAILHRDLKARNVLLDNATNAKLSDFGISRELVVDETMTREVGTSAWIAPEILRGERYSESADIYSLGVLLVEMDRCGHPYADLEMKSYQVALQVSTGSLRPEPTRECPSPIRDLVARCVALEPSSRPTVQEVLCALEKAF